MPQVLDVRRPFTRAEALAAGITDARLRGPAFQRVFPRIHVSARVHVTPRLRAEAALRLHPVTAYLSHTSAARVLDLPVPASSREHVTVRDPDHRRRNPGIACHLASGDVEVMTVGGLRVSSYGQVFVELANVLDLVDLVAVGDHLARRDHLTPARLRAHCAASRLPGSVAARRAAAYVRPRVDSPMETRLRMLLVLGGLPEPQINLVVRDDDGTPLRRYDLSHPTVRTAVEYDGRQHVERVESWERDLDRREASDDDGWRMLVVTSAGIYREPEKTLRRVHRVLLARGLPGVPARLDPAWQPHFRGLG